MRSVYKDSFEELEDKATSSRLKEDQIRPINLSPSKLYKD